MVKFSEIIIANIDDNIYALMLYSKSVTKYGLFSDEPKEYLYKYIDVLDGEKGKTYSFKEPINNYKPITFYMTEEEIINYLNKTDEDKDKSNTCNGINFNKIIARAIKYEQEKLNKSQQEEIKKLLLS